MLVEEFLELVKSGNKDSVFVIDSLTNVVKRSSPMTYNDLINQLMLDFSLSNDQARGVVAIVLGWYEEGVI